MNTKELIKELKESAHEYDNKVEERLIELFESAVALIKEHLSRPRAYDYELEKKTEEWLNEHGFKE